MINQKAKKIVYDDQKKQYELIDRIGEGGQGLVCKTDHKNTLIKVSRAKRKSTKVEQWEKQIRWVMTQNIYDLNLALPKIPIVRPYVGYTMELMDGLHPLEKEMEITHQKLAEESSIDGYFATGGVNRRLAILKNLAHTLSELHGRGYVYGDLSLSNVFVSQDPTHSEVWLIDCDNITFYERQSFDVMYTPQFGAPEIVKNESNVSVFSDAWSFAVVAFELLTTRLPFDGLMMEDADDFEAMSERAQRGELPWVYDLDDDSNESCGGLPLSMVTTPKLYALFERCFTQGKLVPFSRPTLNEWRLALQESLDLLLSCPQCQGQFFYQSQKDAQICPFCNHELDKNQFVLFEQVLENENADECYLLGHLRVLSQGRSLYFSHVPYATELWCRTDPSCCVELDDVGNLYFSTIRESDQMEICRGTRSVMVEKVRILKEKREEGLPYQVCSWNKTVANQPEHLSVVKSYRWQFM